MRQIRKLYLQNAAGARIDLNGAEGVYATDLTGFGSQASNSYGDLGRGFYLDVDPVRAQTTLGFTLKFTRKATAYAQYLQLTQWIAAAGGGLLLLYEPPGTALYYRRVELARLTKKEKTRVGWLEIPVELKPLTPWYLPSSVAAAAGEIPEDAMRYDLGRYGRGRYLASHVPAFAAQIEPMGDEPAAFTVTYAGAASDLVLSLVGLSTGAVYGRCEIDYEFLTGDVLEYSSAPRDSYCRVRRGGTVIDLEGRLDLTGEPYILMPVSEGCLLQLSASEMHGSAEIRASYYFSTV